MRRVVAEREQNRSVESDQVADEDVAAPGGNLSGNGRGTRATPESCQAREGAQDDAELEVVRPDRVRAHHVAIG